MQITRINNNIKNSVTYIIWSDDVDYCVLIDCGEFETLAPILKELNKRVKTVLLTHGHSDHIYGLPKLLEFDNKICLGTNSFGHEEIKNVKKNLSLYNGYPFVVSDYQPIVISDGMHIHFEGLADVEVLYTPGHDESCLTYLIGNNLFTGDAYIPGINVFSKFPNGNKKKAQESEERLKAMEMNGYIIHCGHHSYKRLK